MNSILPYSLSPSLSLDSMMMLRPMMENEAMMVTDTNHIIVAVNEAFIRLTGFPQEEILGKNADILKSKRHRKKFFSQMQDSLTHNGYWEGELWNRRKNGKLFAARLSIRKTTPPEHSHIYYISIFRDITENMLAAKRIEKMAYHDALTNLPNRALLAERLQQNIIRAKRENKQFAVLFLDLDHFKPANDLSGHETGDKLLIEVAKRIRTNLRQHDIVARFGGDEFIIILTCIKAEADVNLVSKKLISLIAQSFILGKNEFKISASIGASFYPKDGETAELLIHHADIAMYQAKAAGGNQVRFFGITDDSKIKKIILKLNNIFLLKTYRQILVWRKS